MLCLCNTYTRYIIHYIITNLNDDIQFVSLEYIIISLIKGSKTIFLYTESHCKLWIISWQPNKLRKNNTLFLLYSISYNAFKLQECLVICQGSLLHVHHGPQYWVYFLQPYITKWQFKYFVTLFDGSFVLVEY